MSEFTHLCNVCLKYQNLPANPFRWCENCFGARPSILASFCGQMPTEGYTWWSSELLKTQGSLYIYALYIEPGNSRSIGRHPDDCWDVIVTNTEKTYEGFIRVNTIVTNDVELAILKLIKIVRTYSSGRFDGNTIYVLEQPHVVWLASFRGFEDGVFTFTQK